jgi:NADP-dependent aldehyde dehydrogenase
MSDTSTPTKVSEAVGAAAAARAAVASAPYDERASWLDAVADALDANAAELWPIAHEEAHLGETRLTGEIARTSGQLRLFAGAVREGSFIEAIIDHPDPSTTPPTPDLRRMLVPLGPVAVFGASNFPFAFSVLGGDTASALAAGNPVVVKAHEGHLRLSRRVSEIALEALERAGAPAGIFGLVEGREEGVALVEEPRIAAVGFTGSVAGGRFLFDVAARRPNPIPFYGELGSINPVVVTEGAAAARVDELADGLVGSFTMGVGQFCTKPGVVFAPAEAGLVEAVGERIAPDAKPLLNERIGDGFRDRLGAVAGHPAVTVVAGGEEPQDPGLAAPVVLSTSVDAVLGDPDVLLDEVFGPATLVVGYDSLDQVRDALAVLPGSLTATVHAEPDDDVRDLVGELSRVAGRVIYGGWPTGVAVSWAQHHGGPYPSTTSLHTSVGTTAIRRWLRPVAYQTTPDALLPPELQEANPLGIPRRVDGVLVAS